MAAKKKSTTAAHSPHLIVSRPISLLQRDVKFNSGIFKPLLKAAHHIGTKDFGSAKADAMEAAKLLSLKADNAGLTWILIQRSMLSALLQLVEEAWLHRRDDAPKIDETIADGLDTALAGATLEVSEEFFRNPGGLPFVDSCREWFSLWLDSVGFSKPKAAAISNRLRSYFVYALNQEWRERRERYAAIINDATTPFTKAGEREKAWEQYAAWLEQDLDSPLFGEPYSLRQLYVPLRTYYLEEEPSEKCHEPGPSRIEQQKLKRIALPLTETILAWVPRTDKDEAVRIISGGPGSGKSSVAKILTAAVLKETNWQALYIPLHRIKYKGDIAPAIADYLRDTQLLSGINSPLDPADPEPRLLLIFDGLDELAMQGKMAQDTALQFVRAVKDMVQNANARDLRLKALLTGRTVIMPSLDSEFRKQGAILHLLPYYVPEWEKDQYSRGWELLEEDQRQQWWKNYGTQTGAGYLGLPKQFNRDSLIEVSSEPLLNYLLAMAYESKKLDFTRDVTENQIYASLVQAVYDRKWSDQQHFATQGMKADHFHRVLEEIAVAAWHGDGRKTTVGEIKQHCQEAGILRMLEVFQDGAENGVLRLLTAFFFRKSGERSDTDAFEFTHKSFGEYLVARCMIRLLDEMVAKLQEQKEKFTGWDERLCLEKWARLCGPTVLTERQWQFLKNEMHFAGDRPGQWQLMLTELINTMLRQGMPMEKLGLPNYLTMRDQARNAEEALLVALDACARLTKTLSPIDWPEHVSFGTWLKFLQGQRTDGANKLSHQCLNRISLKGQLLHFGDLYGASLEFTLFGQFARGVMLEDANLHGADLREANLFLAVLTGANLENANLERASLVQAKLTEAKLVKANLTGADLTRAKLTGANLTRAKLTAAKLTDADLTGADLTGTDLTRTDLSGADLTETKLDLTSLTLKQRASIIR